MATGPFRGVLQLPTAGAVRSEASELPERMLRFRTIPRTDRRVGGEPPIPPNVREASRDPAPPRHRLERAALRQRQIAERDLHAVVLDVQGSSLAGDDGGAVHHPR